MALRVLRTGGLWFDGVNDYVKVLHSASLNLTTAITIIAWINPITLPSSYPRIIIKETGTNLNSYGLFIDRAVNRFVGALSSGRIVEGGTPILNSWQHVGFTWDNISKSPKLYVNGALVATGSSYAGPITSTTYDVLIGNNPTNERQFNGFIDEVRIYNRALSAGEVSEIYSKGTLIKDGLVLYLPFHEGEGDIAHDVSGYNNHGTIYGDPVWAVKKALAR